MYIGITIFVVILLIADVVLETLRVSAERKIEEEEIEGFVCSECGKYIIGSPSIQATVINKGECYDVAYCSDCREYFYDNFSDLFLEENEESE